jgi:Protein of unknown function (DUF2797)
VLTAVPADLPSARAAGRHGEYRRVIGIGLRVAWRLRGPRRCTGVWTGTRRLPCPAWAALADGTDPQCAVCAAADRGRAIARDAALGDDDRTYTLYLAWFGPGLIKIGLTAADRRRDRLLEQGAIACTMLASGPYTPIRRAERRVAAAGLAPERLPARAKTRAWWDLLGGAERARELTAARQVITGYLAGHDGVDLLPCLVADQASDFGLDQPPPGAYQEVTGIADGAGLAGEIRLMPGRHLLFGTASGPLLADMRRIAGWTLEACAPDTTSAIETITRTRPQDHHDDQQALF